MSADEVAVVTIPKSKMESSFDLREVFPRSGIVDIFSHFSSAECYLIHNKKKQMYPTLPTKRLSM